MKIFTGTDIVDIKKFQDSWKNSGQRFLDKLFTLGEQQNKDVVHLAGLFAAKESIMKALTIEPGHWLEIEISYQKSGRPLVKLPRNVKVDSFDLSISHTKKTAIAVFVALDSKKP